MSFRTGSDRSTHLGHRWEPESPFSDNALFYTSAEREDGNDRRAASSFMTESPFLSEQTLRGQQIAVDEAAEAAAEVLGELYDPEMDEAVYELVQEASGLAAGRMVLESGDTAAQDARLTRMLTDHFSPLVRVTEETLDAIGEHLEAIDPLSLSEAEFEAEFDRFADLRERLSPSFEQLAKKVVKKGKKAAKGAVKKTKKKGGGLFLKSILQKLGALVKPLIQKIIQMALDKVPAQYKPLVIKIGRKLGFLKGDPRSAGKAKPVGKPKRKPVIAPKPPEPVEPDQGASDAGDSDAGAAADTPSAAEPDVDAGPVEATATDAGPAGDGTADAPADADIDAAGQAGTPAEDGGSDVMDSAPPDAEPAAADVGDIQSELDARIAELLFAETEMEHEAVASTYVGHATRPAADPLSDLDRARRRFVRDFRELHAGESAEVVVEEFIPAILAAVRLGIKIIGRPKVVQFLGGLIGKLITPFVGKDLGPDLGKALADIGLRVILHAEVSPDRQLEAAGRAVANTVEETVRRVAGLSSSVLDNEALLEAYALEAFEKAAASNFPPQFVKPDLHESDLGGVWLTPPGPGRKYYQKWSRVLDIEISPKTAAAVHTFGGNTLLSVLKEALRLPFTAPIKARVHLFRVMPGGRLAHIAQAERVRGLGHPGAYKLLHPLTPQAAAVLLREPRLGLAVKGALDPLRPVVGQRFFYLEIDVAPTVPAGKPSQLHVVADFPKDEIRVCLFLSEPLAQEIAALLRRKVKPAAVIAKLRAAMRTLVGQLPSESHQLVRIVIEKPGAAPKPPVLAGVALKAVQLAFRKKIGAHVMEWVWTRLAEMIEKGADSFLDAANADADGVTVCLTLHNPDGFQAIRAALKGAPPSGRDVFGTKLPTATIAVHPGFEAHSGAAHPKPQMPNQRTRHE